MANKTKLKTKRKRLRRTVSVLSLFTSFIILFSTLTAGGTHSLAAENTKRELQSRVAALPQFTGVAAFTEVAGDDLPKAVPTAAEFEKVLSKGFEEQDHILYVNNRLYSKRVMESGNTVYVGVSDFVYVLDQNANITQSASSVSISTGSVSLSAKAGSSYIVANGRYLWCSDGVKSENGILMLPLGTLCTVFGIAQSFDGERISVTSTGVPIESGDTFYNKDALYWLSRIISAESRGEPFRGKLAVGNVVMNRVRSKSFPNTVYGVIFDKTNGVQFSPVALGTIYNTPDADSVIAAKLCLEGVSVSNNILYFLNPDTATNFWIPENRTYVTAIGNHKFYS